MEAVEYWVWCWIWKGLSTWIFARCTWGGGCGVVDVVLGTEAVRLLDVVLGAEGVEHEDLFNLHSGGKLCSNDCGVENGGCAVLGAVVETEGAE
eukprot:8065629-Pyramimonas_sp.AAC.1